MKTRHTFKNLEAFLRDLTALSQRYQVSIVACGCCCPTQLREGPIDPPRTYYQSPWDGSLQHRTEEEYREDVENYKFTYEDELAAARYGGLAAGNVDCPSPAPNRITHKEGNQTMSDLSFTYVAIGNKGWGKGDRISTAIRNAREAGKALKPGQRYDVLRCSDPSVSVDGARGLYMVRGARLRRVAGRGDFFKFQCDCCYGEDHEGPCCPGWFVNEEMDEIERCDSCRLFPDDDAARVFANGEGPRRGKGLTKRGTCTFYVEEPTKTFVRFVRDHGYRFELRGENRKGSRLRVFNYTLGSFRGIVGLHCWSEPAGGVGHTAGVRPGTETVSNPSTVSACAIQVRPKPSSPMAATWPLGGNVGLIWAWVSWSYTGKGKNRQAFVSGFVTQLTEGDEKQVFFAPELADNFAPVADRHFNFDEAARGGKWEDFYEIRVWGEEG